MSLIPLICPRGNVVSVPTTWDPANKGAQVTLSGGDLGYASTGSSTTLARSVFSTGSGKYYWEIRPTSGLGANTLSVGVVNSSQSVSEDIIGDTANGWSYRSFSGNKYNNGSGGGAGTAYGSTFTNNDYVGVALDMDVGKLWFSKNGVWQNSGDPAAGTGEAFSGLTGALFAAVAANDISLNATANFGGTPMQYTPPVGFAVGFGA